MVSVVILKQKRAKVVVTTMEEHLKAARVLQLMN